METNAKDEFGVVPAYVQKYRDRTNVKIFLHSRPFKKGEKDESNEFKDLWLNNTFLVVENNFPSFFKRTEVIQKKNIELDPLQCAITQLTNKTKEMWEMIDNLERYLYDPNSKVPFNNQWVQPLSMSLTGVIDAAVNGGISKYQAAFLLGENDYPTAEKNKLKIALQKQLVVTERCLIIHGRVCTSEMRKLQEHLEEMFGKMKLAIEKSTI